MRASGDRTLRWRVPAAAAAAGLLLALAAGAPAPAAEEEKKGGLKEALANGKTTIDLRYRYETVDEERDDKDAHASTLRTALGYRTRAYKGFSFQIEVENVAVLGNDLYGNAGSGSLDNRVRDRPVVADPAVTEINQALVRYQGDRWQVAAGRQEVALGDSRFVGNVGWRQNHQSFDALRVDNSSLGGLRFTYVYLDRVHRITGQSLDLAGHLLNAGFELQNIGRFTLYGYLLDYENRGFGALSTATWGLEFAGKRRLGGGGRRALLYEVEYAIQSDHAGNTRSIDADYSSLMLGVSLAKVNVRLAREALSGATGSGGQFQTPLATLHGFNGWADRFSTIPALGLVDLNLQLDGKIGEVAWLVRYHEFDSEIRDFEYGSELDLRLLYSCPKGVLFGLKGALFDRAGVPDDTHKWMLWGAYSF